MGTEPTIGTIKKDVQDALPKWIRWQTLYEKDELDRPVHTRVIPKYVTYLYKASTIAPFYSDDLF
ncbi:hypothetical protein HHI36_023353 [Cryptolaemus montrouzieri]|uniref:Uncharacterized protein n=1 Tax=Cryptolaemus montrouzieri TaxID=559131 RepID=A0ABD2PHS2_9CUCU